MPVDEDLLKSPSTAQAPTYTASWSSPRNSPTGSASTPKWLLCRYLNEKIPRELHLASPQRKRDVSQVEVARNTCLRRHTDAEQRSGHNAKQTYRKSDVERFVTMPPSGDSTATADRPPLTSRESAVRVGALMSTVMRALVPACIIPAYPLLALKADVDLPFMGHTDLGGTHELNACEAGCYQM